MRVMKLTKELVLQSKTDTGSRVIPSGTDVTVFPENHKIVGITDVKFKLPWKIAHKYFDEVIEITDEVICNAISDDCVTVLGDSIEPDGKDSEGYPSVLIAIGIM